MPPDPNGFRSVPAYAITQITTTGRAGLAAISPDGNFVVSAEEHDGRQSLWLRNIATSTDTQIEPPLPVSYGCLDFSPDGNYIYVCRSTTARGLDLARMSLLGGAQQLVVPNISSDITFAPGGKQIAYLRANDPEPGKWSLFIANADGTGRGPPHTTSRSDPYRSRLGSSFRLLTIRPHI